MSATQNDEGSYWGYLINHEAKSAAPLLSQLCDGLAKIIAQLVPGPNTDLTPQQLSAFYKSVGGSDYFFQKLGYPGLSLMYKTLGCFHSLQPTANAFELPSVPCLLPAGFVRWQTIQLLLHPDEHVQCLQKAVEIYDIPKPGGGIFPKTIPRESFPSKPDEAMEKWHNFVLEKLDEGQHRRLKNSPYCSPYEAPDRGEDYFPRSPHMRRTSRPPRTDNQDPSHGFPTSSRRRSSVPAVPSPIHNPEHNDNHHWSSDHAYSAPNSAIPQSPRHRPVSSSASQRPVSQSYHHATNSHNPNTTSAKSFNLSFENFHIPFISSTFRSKKSRERSSASAARTRVRPRSPSRYDAVSTGSEASSEESIPRLSRYDRERRRSSLAPPTNYNPYQRRHSHDASYQASPKYMPAFPPPTPRGHADQNHSRHSHVPAAGPVPGPFREDHSNNGPGASSATELPNNAYVNPKVRVIDPVGRDRSDERGRVHRTSGGASLLERRAISAERRSRSNDRRGGVGMDRYGNVDQDTLDLRGAGKPLRVNTIGGSGNRRVRNPEVRSAGIPNLRRAPPTGLSGGGRR